MLQCWCGNPRLELFSLEYAYCRICGTLVSGVGLTREQTLVKDDEQDFYGKNYWFRHQSQDLGFPTIVERARSDLTERALAWLRLVLKYKLPPGTTIELGCAHGGFVALLRQAGFESSGLEMSPAIVDFAVQSFAIPMLVGRIEDQALTPGTLDAVVLMDVLEHLPDPLSTMTLCASLLKTDGCVVVQTPCFREQSSYGDMVASNDPFLQQMKSDEHLFLLSQRAVRRFMQQAGASEVVFEPAFFGHYDMAFVASGSPLKSNSPQAIERALLSTPGGRLVQAILDLDAAGAQARAQFATCEADRAERGKQIDTLLRQLALSEEDRAARLDVINRLSAQLAAREAECAAQRKLIEELRAHVDRNEKLKGTGQA